MLIPPVIYLGPLPIHLYGICIALGILVGAKVAERVASQQHDSRLKVDDVWWLMLAGVLGGIIGARAYHVIDRWQYYASRLDEVIAVWSGGLGIYGGLLGAMIGIGVYAVVRELRSESNQKRVARQNLVSKLVFRFLLYADLAAITMPLGQAIGRLGNWVNQELFGLPTSLPWAIFIEPRFRLAGYELYERFHPLFAYEAIWSLISFGVVYGWIYKTKQVPLGRGVYLSVYLLLYSFGRFWLETLRINPWTPEIWGGRLTTAQWLSLLVFVSSGLYLMLRWKKQVQGQIDLPPH